MGVRMFIQEPAGPTTEGFIVPVQLGMRPQHVRKDRASRAPGMHQADPVRFRRLDHATEAKETTDHTSLESRPGRGHLGPPSPDGEPIILEDGVRTRMCVFQGHLDKHPTVSGGHTEDVRAEIVRVTRTKRSGRTYDP